MFGSESPLHHLREFQAILKNYRPNLEILDILQRTQLVLLVAPAAAGRNTIIRNLIMTGKYHFVVSDTTRRPRINNGTPERSGEEYWFRSEEEFLQGLRNIAYVEAAIIHQQQVSGISLQELRLADRTGKIAITDVEIQGCDAIKSYSDTTIPVFVLPPAFDEWMHRLDGRGLMDPEEKRRRLESAVNEIQFALQRSYFKFVINWDLRNVLEELHEHISTRSFPEDQQTVARAHAQELLQQLDIALH